MKKEEYAFPVIDSLNADGSGLHCYHAGMTLRDYFAGKALAGLLATTIDWSEKYGKEKVCRIIAEMSYELSDAMLAEREKQREGK
jgi:hypothetical protein